MRHSLIMLMIGLLLAPSLGYGHPRETAVVNDWCRDKGQDEVALPDKTRVDCLTSTHAIEADWAKKWYEAIGQSLYYASQTNKRAGILLIQRPPWDRLYYRRCLKTIEYYNLPIDVWWLEIKP